MWQKLYIENEQLQQIEVLCNMSKIAYSSQGLFMRPAILHGETYRMIGFLESLDLPLEGHRASFSTSLNGQKPIEMHGALIKLNVLELGLGCALL